ncbi:hypothetical protein [Luedemannella helvata]|uniref:Uncharacterized protein n=1 Tax=Luedemannella helvata TaxID=349315 RepID=A0ABN2K4F4_9ACTN
MSNTVQSPKPRPTVVTAAVGLLYAAAGILFLLGIISISNAGTMSDVYEEAYRGTSAESAGGTIGTASSWGSGALYIVFAIVMLVLAIFVGRGKQPARITTWVVAGLVALCCGCGGILGAASGSLTDSLTSGAEPAPGQPDPAELQRLLDDRLPSWYTPATTTLAILLTLACLAVVILLALPAAHPYFRKEPEVWLPPTNWPPAPGTPGYPGTPGAPGTPGTDPNQPPAPPTA